MFYPSLKKAKQLSKGYMRIPVAMELMADLKTSIEILRNIKNKSEHCFILESVAGADSWSRYSFLGYMPTLTIKGCDGVITMTENGTSSTRIASPIKMLRELLREYRSPVVEGLPPFTGGLVGYFSYDFMKYITPAPALNGKNPQKFDDFQLMLMDKVIAFDHFKQKIFLITNISSQGLEQNYANAVATLKDMERLVLENTVYPAENITCGKFSAAMEKERFCQGVEALRRHIVEGDIFQAVLSNRYSAPFEGSLLETYRVLRTTNPSPYMVYMHLDDMEIACSSPETLVTLRGGKLNSFPLAGTKPRCDDDMENTRRGEALLGDEKELSEHDMLVDLARNDLAKISAFGSVALENYRQVKHYSHVMHIASTVTGVIAEGKDALDAVAATLPAGTLSGAPKKKACELIDELEDSKRGPYGGAMGYIDFTGNADFCIGIRMAVRKNGNVFVQSGAGIVADSVPEHEYEETLHKARVIMEALGSEEATL